MRLRPFRSRTPPSTVDGHHEEFVPPFEQLEPERFEPVHVSVRGEDRAVIARFAQEHLTPVVDQPWYVDGPINLGDLSEHRTEKIVERDFPVEVDDEIMDLRSRPEVTVPETLRDTHEEHLASANSLFARFRRPADSSGNTEQL